MSGGARYLTDKIFVSFADRDNLHYHNKLLITNLINQPVSTPLSVFYNSSLRCEAAKPKRVLTCFPFIG